MDDLFFTITFIFYEKAKQPAVRDMLRHFHGLYKRGPGLYSRRS